MQLLTFNNKSSSELKKKNSSQIIISLGAVSEKLKPYDASKINYYHEKRYHQCSVCDYKRRIWHNFCARQLAYRRRFARQHTQSSHRQHTDPLNVLSALLKVLYFCLTKSDSAKKTTKMAFAVS